MAEKSGWKDKFANMAILTVLESAANTLTFKKLETAVSITDKIAWVIHKVEYTIDSLLAAVFNGDGDGFYFGLSCANTFTAVTIGEPLIIDFNAVGRRDYGAAATAMVDYAPFVKDFSSFPAGGILVPPIPLYGFAKGSGLVAADGWTARIFYSTLTLTPDEYWELVETRRVIQS